MRFNLTGFLVSALVVILIAITGAIVGVAIVQLGLAVTR